MNKNKHGIDKAYVSELDVFLDKFDKTHPQSASQLKEREKHASIAYLRDNVIEEIEKIQIWEEF